MEKLRQHAGVGRLTRQRAVLARHVVVARRDPFEVVAAASVELHAQQVHGLLEDHLAAVLLDRTVDVFRRLMNPIGGPGGLAIDLSPIIAVIVLLVVRTIIVSAIINP